MRGRELERTFLISSDRLDAWVRQRGLPVHSFDGRLFASAFEILEWALAHDVRPECDFLHPGSASKGGVLAAAAMRGQRDVLAGESPLDEMLAHLPISETLRAMTRVTFAPPNPRIHVRPDGTALPSVYHPLLVPGRPPALYVHQLQAPWQTPAGRIERACWILAPTAIAHREILLALCWALGDAATAALVGSALAWPEVAARLGAQAKTLPSLVPEEAP